MEFKPKLYVLKDKRMKKIILLSSIFLTSTVWGLNEGFDFGKGCEAGSGSFDQQINYFDSDYENAITVGEIPVGIENLKITLTSDKDVDIRLYTKQDKIVHWPFGLLSSAGKSTIGFKDVQVSYSGYAGVAGEKGNEYIEIIGKTPEKMTMKAFGFEAGVAHVTYSWTGKGECSEQAGSKKFTQEIKDKNISVVGTIPTHISNFTVNLTSAKDLDIQLYDANGTAIVSWEGGILNGATKQTLNYHGMHIEWSGYDGDAASKGNEYIKISGFTTKALVMKVYGYEAGYAEVNYSWGSTTPTDEVCTKIYQPVCGIDPYAQCLDINGTNTNLNCGQKTYANSCVLDNAGAVKLYTGECITLPKIPSIKIPKTSNDTPTIPVTTQQAPTEKPTTTTAVCGVDPMMMCDETIGSCGEETFEDNATLKDAKALYLYDGACKVYPEIPLVPPMPEALKKENNQTLATATTKAPTAEETSSATTTTTTAVCGVDPMMMCDETIGSCGEETFEDNATLKDAKALYLYDGACKVYPEIPLVPPFIS